MMKKVQILMSTYNGETYLSKQIDSILAQNYPAIQLLIRDDGSKDNTKEILKEYENKFEQITVIYGENVGVNGSFFSLVEMSDADYIAFADQDDIWLPDKVKKAVEQLEQVQGAALYACNKILIDGNDNIIKENDGRKMAPSFSNALVESICTGCTIVMNRKLTEQLKIHIPEHAVLHDWWCYLLAAYLGTVIYDENAYIWYRQHENNVVGAANHIWDKIKFNVHYILKNRGKLKWQLEEFAQLYHTDAKKDRQLQRVSTADKFPQSIKVAFGKDVKRQTLPDEIIMRLLFICHLMI